MIYPHAADFYVTRQTLRGLREDDYGNCILEITIVAEQGIREPDFFDDANQAATVMFVGQSEV